MKCADCKFSSAQVLNHLSGGYGIRRTVECRFNPPTIKSFDWKDEDDVTMVEISTVFPVIDADTWCGKFEPK